MQLPLLAVYRYEYTGGKARVGDLPHFQSNLAHYASAASSLGRRVVRLFECGIYPKHQTPNPKRRTHQLLLWLAGALVDFRHAVVNKPYERLAIITRFNASDIGFGVR